MERVNTGGSFTFVYDEPTALDPERSSEIKKTYRKLFIRKIIEYALYIAFFLTAFAFLVWAYFFR